MHRSKKDSVHSFITTKDVIPAGVSSADQSKKTGMLYPNDSLRSAAKSNKARHAVASPKLSKLSRFKGTGSMIVESQSISDRQNDFRRDEVQPFFSPANAISNAYGKFKVPVFEDQAPYLS